MARAMGARTQLAFAYESVYGTAPASGFMKLSMAESKLASAQPLIDSELLGFGRDPLAPIKDAITADGDITIPLDVDGIGYWLKAIFGAPVTTGTTPKVHTFQTGGWTLPSMSIEVGFPDIPTFKMFSGVRVNDFKFNMQRTGNLQATVGLIAQGETPNVASQAGTLGTLVNLTRFGQFNGAIKRNGAALGNIVSGDVTYSNNLDRVETIRSDGKIEGADPGMASMKGALVARFADTTLITDAQNGTPCELEFSWVISASQSLKITVHAVYLPVPRIEIPGPGGIQATYDWQAAQSAAVTPARMATIVLTNAVAGY